ncbi:hypothetical protein GY45DRAFT_1263066 [Cubamyces sp. BRFM 1775]|nr:hypothetical protein GY45DRAFT_1263066 [Cubamyces sp. BRFM 1775]
MGSIIVINSSSSDIFVFVSKHSNSSGFDDWSKLAPGERDAWSRNEWELVAFRNADDTARAGVYVPAWQLLRDVQVIDGYLGDLTSNARW